MRGNGSRVTKKEGLLILRRSFLIQMADRFEALEQALDLGLVVGKHQGVVRRGELSSRGSGAGGFAPELAIGHAVDQSFASVAAEAAQQAARRIRITGIHYHHLGFVGQCEPDGQGKIRAAIQPADLFPGYGGATDLDVTLVDLNGRPRRQVQHQDGGCQKNSGWNPVDRPGEGEPDRNSAQRQSRDAGPQEETGYAIATDRRRHTVRVTLGAVWVNREG